MAGKKGMKHYPVTTKREAVRLCQEEGKSYQEITELLEIVDPLASEERVAGLSPKRGCSFSGGSTIVQITIRLSCGSHLHLTQGQV